MILQQKKETKRCSLFTNYNYNKIIKPTPTRVVHTTRAEKNNLQQEEQLDLEQQLLKQE